MLKIRHKGSPKVFGFIGIIALGAAVYFGLSTLSFVRAASFAQATVTGITREEGQCKKSGKHRRSYPCIKYRAEAVFYSAAGAQISINLSAGSHRTSCTTCSASKRPGDRVELLYDPANPAQAREAGFGSLWALPAGLGFIGFIFIGVAGAGSLMRSNRPY